ncbi:MAG: hypothetical protein ACYC69_00215 [Thermodesulfovibrionales bacterium]
MNLPKFDRVPMSLPFWVIFTRQYAEALSSAKELYLALGGHPSSGCLAENPTLAVLEGAIGKLLSKATKSREIRRCTSKSSPMDSPFSMVSCNIVKGTVALEAILNVDFHIFYVFYLDFLEGLRKQRPEVYKLVRLIIRGMSAYLPCETVGSIFERRFDVYSDEIDELTAAGEHAAVKEIKHEQKEFNRHVKALRIRMPVFIRRLTRRYRKVSGSLKRRENKWVRDAIEMFEHALVAMDMDYRFDDSEDGDRIDLNCCFNLFWKEGSYVSDSTLHEYEYCEAMGPMVRVVVRSRTDVEKFVSMIRMYYLFAQLLSKGGHTWR